MSTLYCIDGYNVIHFCRKLKPLTMSNFEAARDSLIERVSRYCTITGDRAKIVFDGRNRRGESELPLHGGQGLEVLFSPGHLTADTVIERFVHASANRREIVVISGDRGIRDLCRGLGALVLTPESFLSSMDTALTQSRASLQREATKYSSNPVEERLSDKSVRRLQKHRDRLHKRPKD
ncbi:MAG: NYN domain-containing protein [Candidatus Hydrogenedentes bacterium]|nr:NYN domain-containing protein [Candidatus Hydrogenedentota bacterium]